MIATCVRMSVKLYPPPSGKPWTQTHSAWTLQRSWQKPRFLPAVESDVRGNCREQFPPNEVEAPLREAQAAIPRFFLYGEPPRDPGERFVHVETIADRSRVHDWRIQPHAHRDLHQLLVISSGGGEMEAETQRQEFRAPALLIVPAGIVHGFSFAEDTEGYV